MRYLQLAQRLGIARRLQRMVHGGKVHWTSVPIADTLGTKRGSNGAKPRIVHRENQNGRATNFRFPDQIFAIPVEMVGPLIPARVKQRDYFAGLEVFTGNIRTLALVAVEARKGQILQARLAAVLSGDYMVDMKRT